MSVRKFNKGIFTSCCLVVGTVVCLFAKGKLSPPNAALVPPVGIYRSAATGLMIHRVRLSACWSSFDGWEAVEVWISKYIVGFLKFQTTRPSKNWLLLSKHFKITKLKSN